VQVIYNTSGWLDKNNDPPPTDFLEAIKEKSTFGFSKVQYSPVLTAVRMGFSL
jgi:myosin heavy subunit